MDKPEEPIDYSRPVAYDINGRPLYAHPPVDSPQIERRSNNKVWDGSIESPIISDSIKLKHIKSQNVFPELALNEGDYVISAVRRHPIGLLLPFIVGVLVIALAFIVLFNYDIVIKVFQLSGSVADASVIFWPVIVFAVLVLMSEYIVYYVYINNRFFLTNESVIQQIQTGIFSNGEQIVSLGNIEDASYSQNGIMQQLFNYGSIRLSTEGEETTYRFTFVVDPKGCIATLDNAIENFKNCRPPC
ncbi:MAG: PH domain-containing protein [Candidatus Saccharibacteria bacterium]